MIIKKLEKHLVKPYQQDMDWVTLFVDKIPGPALSPDIVSLIKLPVNSNGDPDFGYVEVYIKLLQFPISILFF